MGLIHCQGCNRLISDYLEACPNCDHPNALAGSRSWMFWEEWLLMTKVLLGMALLGFLITLVVGSDSLVGFFGRLSLLSLIFLVVGKLGQWLLFKLQNGTGF